MYPIAMSALADEHIHDLHANAARQRLLALAGCCRPATWRRSGARLWSTVTAWTQRGQLGPTANYCPCP